MTNFQITNMSGGPETKVQFRVMTKAAENLQVNRFNPEESIRPLFLSPKDLLRGQRIVLDGNARLPADYGQITTDFNRVSSWNVGVVFPGHRIAQNRLEESNGDGTCQCVATPSYFQRITLIGDVTITPAFQNLTQAQVRDLLTADQVVDISVPTFHPRAIWEVTRKTTNQQETYMALRYIGKNTHWPTVEVGTLQDGLPGESPEVNNPVFVDSDWEYTNQPRNLTTVRAVDDVCLVDDVVGKPTTLPALPWKEYLQYLDTFTSKGPRLFYFKILDDDRQLVMLKYQGQEPCVKVLGSTFATLDTQQLTLIAIEAYQGGDIPVTTTIGWTNRVIGARDQVKRAVETALKSMALQQQGAAASIGAAAGGGALSGIGQGISTHYQNKWDAKMQNDQQEHGWRLQSSAQKHGHAMASQAGDISGELSFQNHKQETFRDMLRAQTKYNMSKKYHEGPQHSGSPYRNTHNGNVFTTAPPERRAITQRHPEIEHEQRLAIAHENNLDNSVISIGEAPGATHV